MTAGGCLLPEDRDRLSQVAWSIALTFIADQFEGEAPDPFVSEVVAAVEDQLVGSLEDLTMPDLEVWRGERAA